MPHWGKRLLVHQIYEGVFEKKNNVIFVLSLIIHPLCLQPCILLHFKNHLLSVVNIELFKTFLKKLLLPAVLFGKCSFFYLDELLCINFLHFLYLFLNYAKKLFVFISRLHWYCKAAFFLPGEENIPQKCIK